MADKIEYRDNKKTMFVIKPKPGITHVYSVERLRKLISGELPWGQMDARFARAALAEWLEYRESSPAAPESPETRLPCGSERGQGETGCEGVRQLEVWTELNDQIASIKARLNPVIDVSPRKQRDSEDGDTD